MALSHVVLLGNRYRLLALTASARHIGGFVAYYRVSTGRQGKSGLGIEAQRAAVATYLNGGNWHIAAEFTEVESGKRSDRPELDKALSTARLHRVPLIVSKVDRPFGPLTRFAIVRLPLWCFPGTSSKPLALDQSKNCARLIL
jgi:hypothetical protein